MYILNKIINGSSYIYNSACFLFNRLVDCCQCKKARGASTIKQKDTDTQVQLETRTISPVKSEKEQIADINKARDAILNNQYQDLQEVKDTLKDYFSAMTNPEYSVQLHAMEALQHIVHHASTNSQITHTLVIEFTNFLNSMGSIDANKMFFYKVRPFQLHVLDLLPNLIKNANDQKISNIEASLDQMANCLLGKLDMTNNIGQDKIVLAICEHAEYFRSLNINTLERLVQVFIKILNQPGLITHYNENIRNRLVEIRNHFMEKNKNLFDQYDGQIAQAIKACNKNIQIPAECVDALNRAQALLTGTK